MQGDSHVVADVGVVRLELQRLLIGDHGLAQATGLMVLDRDLNEDLALSYPELYKELTKVRVVTSLAVYVCSHLWTGASLLILGTSIIIQDLLHLAHDQRLSR